MAKEETKKKGGLLQAISRVCFTGWRLTIQPDSAMKTEASMEHLFILITMETCWCSDSARLTIPLRLLPLVSCFTPVSTWKRQNV